VAGNKAVADLRVRSIRILRLDQGGYRPPPERFFAPGFSYKLEAAIGNAAPPITYPDGRYRKDQVQVRIVGRGFRIGDRFFDQAALTFYTNSTFSTPVSGDRFQISFAFAQPFGTSDPDRELEAYFRFGPSVRQRPITDWVWQPGVYASVRDWSLRNIASSV
jgi:hypothetical protein